MWKRGESLRVDTSLLGFEHMTWQRGRRSFIFKGQGELWGLAVGSRGSPVACEDRAVLSLRPLELKTEVGAEGTQGLTEAANT